MQVKHLLSTLALMSVCLAMPGMAATFTYSATLAGASENPANASAGTGFETLSLTGDLLTVNLTFTNLSAAATASHIHCCAATGTNAAVVVPFAGFPNATSGSYTHTFDLSTFSFGGGLTETTFLAGLNAGQAYANIHDANFPAGEIRGQIMASPVPEPGSFALLATGLGAVAGVVRRRHRG